MSKRRLYQRTIFKDFGSSQAYVPMLGPNERRVTIMLSVTGGWCHIHFGEGFDNGGGGNTPSPSGFLCNGQIGNGNTAIPFTWTYDHVGQAVRESIYVNDGGTSCRVTVMEVWEDCTCEYQNGK